jgi:homeobox protein cut-like
MVLAKVAEKEEEFQQEMNDKVRVYKETEYALERQLQQTKDQVISMQSSNDVNQANLIENTQKNDADGDAKLAELEIIMMDFEQAQMKIAELSRENLDLKQRLEGNSDETREQEYFFALILIA